MTILFETHTLITYLLATIVLVLTPGPGQALVIAYTIKGGSEFGVLAALGLEFGTVFHTIAAALGLSAVLATSASAFTIVKLAGAVYLVFLGVRHLMAKEVPARTTMPKALGPTRVLAQATVAGILNPKVALFFLAFLPQFVRPERGAIVTQFVILGGIFSLFGFVGDSLVAITTGYLGKFFSGRSQFQQWRERITGIILIAIGARLALIRRTWL
jgi:threonine/homoserine/homoserine lactone efflux protein